MDITLTGATGFIGRRLVSALTARGDRITVLSRSRRAGTNPRYLTWDANSAPPADAMETDAVIHLAGEPVAQRWTAAAKRRIRDSRIEGTRAMVLGLTAAARKPRVLVSASAVGFYGERGAEAVAENSPRGGGFLADVTAEWEEEAHKAEQLGIRVVTPRIGMVLGGEGGALAKMLPPFRAGVGGRLGSGHQWMSWIHIDDLVGIILFALSDEGMRGPVNATAPNPVTNAVFTRELAAVLHRPAILPVPAVALRILFGEMSSILTGSQRVLPHAALDAGYIFRFPELRRALEDLLRT